MIHLNMLLNKSGCLIATFDSRINKRAPPPPQSSLQVDMQVARITCMLASKATSSHLHAFFFGSIAHGITTDGERVLPIPYLLLSLFYQMLSRGAQ